MTVATYQPRPATLETLAQVRDVLDSYDGDMTLRQVYYQLVARYEYPNREQSYKRLSQVLTKARVAGLIDGDRIVDRTRRVARPYGFADLPTFLSAMRRSYRRPRAQGQPEYVEVWVEKDALAGVFEPITYEYGVRLAVCRGYPSYSAIRDAAQRFTAAAHRQPPKDGWMSLYEECRLLYFGDFDPSGQDIPRCIRDNLAEWFGCRPEVELIALTPEQIEEHELPPAPAKRSDARTEKFVARYGEDTVELDALRPDVLREMIRVAIERYWDKPQHESVLAAESEEKQRLGVLIDAMESENGGELA